ncbi:hypothetical protein MNBD_NITROSPINAE04-883 [hydrothermal vent metagenome]|uniref:FecR protein domain-containing protein n=1 Tax=hydrothermal vent metagenome TaxID=652676 RepID=A0A3B1BVY1_9ZZZZ
MSTKSKIAVVSGLLTAAFLFMAPPSSFAATPIGAKAVYVEGAAHVISVKDKSRRRVELDSTFTEGDRVTTEADGIVEIEFDTGDLVRVDKDTEMVVRSLKRDESGSAFSIFNLVIGRVKSAVGKLATKDSKFEYHTKTAIAGVAGTPPWVIRFHEDVTEIDLLGKEGDKGFVYVQGLDPKKTLVTLSPGTRTIVRLGMAPLKPFPIEPDRIEMLMRTIPFSVKHNISRRKVEKSRRKVEKELMERLGSTGQQLVTSTISNSISTLRQIKPGTVKSVDSTNTQSTSGQGAVGQYDQTGGASSPQPAKIKIKINLH